jgi:hypothetical protein
MHNGTQVVWFQNGKWQVTPAGVSRLDGGERIAAAFIRQNVREASRGFEDDPEFLEAVREFQERSVKGRSGCARPAHDRSRLLHEMKEAEGAEAAFAKSADRNPERNKRAERWYPAPTKRAEWSAC